MPRLQLMTPRACIECDHKYSGVLTCPECGGAGEPLPQGRPPGRPPTPPLDQRRGKLSRTVKLSHNEHAELAAAARDAKISISDYVISAHRARSLADSTSALD